MSKKQDLGQFFTTNSDYILSGFEDKVAGKVVLDPFCGGQDLLNWAKQSGAKHVKGYDIDKNVIDNKVCFWNDSLLHIPKATDYNFSLTNPPYLGKNKMKKSQKVKYDLLYLEDSYLLSLKNIIDTGVDEGIAITPVNLLSAENAEAIRKIFLSIYNITKINYFTEQVFDDTTYNVMAFHYQKKQSPSKKQTLQITFYPSKEECSFEVEQKYGYRIGGRELDEIINGPQPTGLQRISRITENLFINNKSDTDKYPVKAFFNDKKTEVVYYVDGHTYMGLTQNIILLTCIDTREARVKAEDIRQYKKMCLVGKNTSRNMASVILCCGVTIEEQEQIIQLFNYTLDALRDKYKSLFLTNFRDNNRKRVSFEFCYQLINYCMRQIRTSKKAVTQ